MMKRNPWLRTNRHRSCPVCHKNDWCLVLDDDSAAICARVPSNNRRGEAGWLHRLGGSPCPVATRIERIIQTRPVRNWKALSSWYQSQIGSSRLGKLAQQLSLSVGSLSRLGVGWATAADLEQVKTRCRSVGAFTFPMSNAIGETVGIRLRAPDSFKWAIAGSRSGLFVPVDLGHPEQLLIAEGPSDTAALLDLEFAAVGRPSCNTGKSLLTMLVKSIEYVEAVVVADHDAPGKRGAADLASQLVVYCQSVRVIAPPEGIKDVRAWLISGATHNDIIQSVQSAAVWRIAIRS